MQVIIWPWLLAWKTKPREMSLSIKGKPPVPLLYPQTADRSLLRLRGVVRVRSKL
jgi:hypothetical protein